MNLFIFAAFITQVGLGLARQQVALLWPVPCTCPALTAACLRGEHLSGNLVWLSGLNFEKAAS